MYLLTKKISWQINMLNINPFLKIVSHYVNHYVDQASVRLTEIHQPLATKH